MNKAIDERALYQSKIEQYETEANELRALSADISAAMFDKYAEKYRNKLKELEQSQNEKQQNEKAEGDGARE